MQRARFEGTTLACDMDVGPAEVRQYCPVDETEQGLLKAAVQRLAMSVKAFHRILKLARTVAIWPAWRRLIWKN